MTDIKDELNSIGVLLALHNQEAQAQIAFDSIAHIEKLEEYIKVYQDQTNILLTRVEQLEKGLQKIAGKL